MFWPIAGQAQDLFVRKTPAPEAPAEDGAAQEKPKAAPLFLPKAGSGQSQKTVAKPLFLGQPGSNAKTGPGTLFNPAPSSAKVYSLKQKDPKALSADERMSLAMEETRLANLANVRNETARLQAQTMQALARWEADSAAEAARQAALEAASKPAPVPVAAQPKTPAVPLKTSVTRTPEDVGDNRPKPVFNTGR